ncbi:zinc finger protein [Besnoitia besnoiti]|uniref:Zinc finger protein n=1 Tax=Besnoitia besnoiti TaxID=94643 RepID=A0A2A9MBH7_BESBE|nr:zinc finger protein [Besnoitia besnoiti]PFH32742.1 zinc finger protein [Besnoitia besnoiti]
MALNPGGDFRLSEKDLGVVLRDSDEWAFLEYLLQMSVRTSRVRLLQAWNIAPPHLISAFEKRTKGRLLTYSFVDATSLDEENSLQDVARRGLRIPTQGMRFAVGNFSLPGFPLMRGGPGEAEDPFLLPSSVVAAQQDEAKKERGEFLDAARAQLLTGERRVFEFLLCQVGVGRSVVVEDEKEASGSRFSLLWEYDSAYLEKGCPPPEESLTVHYQAVEELKYGEDGVLKRRDDDEGRGRAASLVLDGKRVTPGVLPQYTFRHDYVVYDSSQVLPKFFLLFEMDPALEELFAVPLCDNCQDNPACIWCPADIARLCTSCDELIHKQNKLVSRHIRVPLNEMPRPFGTCKLHPGELYELFCSICHVPVCRLCRGNHLHSAPGKSVGSSGPRSIVAGGRSLMPLNKPYKAILQMARKPHFILAARRSELEKRLDEIQRMLDDVRRNCREEEQRCYAILEEAMTQLHGCSEDKMGVVLSHQLELQREIDTMEWSESFLQYLRSVLPPADFLYAWLRHSRLRDELDSLSGDPAILSRNVFPDMRLQGRVDILTDSALRRRDQCLTQKSESEQVSPAGGKAKEERPAGEKRVQFDPTLLAGSG